MDPWLAPEHQKMASDMRRNKDPKAGPVGHLIVDRRPELLRPKREPRDAPLIFAGQLRAP